MVSESTKKTFTKIHYLLKIKIIKVLHKWSTFLKSLLWLSLTIKKSNTYVFDFRKAFYEINELNKKTIYNYMYINYFLKYFLCF